MKLTKNKDTPENRAYWTGIETAAAELAAKLYYNKGLADALADQPMGEMSKAYTAGYDVGREIRVQQRARYQLMGWETP